MRPVVVVAAGAVSALGVGPEAYRVGEVGDPARTAIDEHPLLREAGFKNPFAARVRAVEQRNADADPWRDRAELLLERAREQLVGELDRALPDWRARRVALCVGTSSGGMQSQERAFAERERGRAIEPVLARAAPYFGPLPGLAAGLGVAAESLVQVLAACASSTVAIGLGCRWLEAGRADLVIAGGYDALALFVAAGFEALGATSRSRPAPFRAERDGMALGEGAALIALCREGEAPPGLGLVLGFGGSSDAVHATAPDRSGKRLASAATSALRDAEVSGSSIDVVSAHGTATPYNDAAEARAIAAALGEHAEVAAIHPFKAVIGHTLGAAGALETLAALDALGRGVLPAAFGSGNATPELRGRLLDRNQRGTPRCCLKLSAAFGGANAALVVGRAGAAGPRARREVRVLAIGEAHTELDIEALGTARVADSSRLSRLDSVSALAVAAAGDALGRCSAALPERCGVIVGSAAASIEVNDAFDARRRSRGARAVEPRRFPATSPNLCAGEVSIAFGLHGLSFSVGAGPAAATEALLVAVDLLEAGDADAFLVIAVDHVGPAVVDLWSSAGWTLPERGAAAALLGTAAEGGLDSGAVLDLHRAAVGAGGRIDGSPPGWPALLAALRRLG